MANTMTSRTYRSELRAVLWSAAGPDMSVAARSRGARGAAVFGTEHGTRMPAFGASGDPAMRLNDKSIVAFPHTNVVTRDVAGALGIFLRSLSPPV